jgi:hypothetical protein
MIQFIGFIIYIFSVLGLVALLYYSDREIYRGRSVRQVLKGCFHWTFLTPVINTLVLVVICFVCAAGEVWKNCSTGLKVG